MKNNWYVITGGPSTGKSTLIEVLNKKGYKTFPESARVIIDESIKKGTSLLSLRANEKEFQTKVLQHKKELESKHDSKILTFFDRGMHDTLAYLELNNLSIEKDLFELLDKTKYKKIFLLNPLDEYILDYARTETLEEALKLNNLLRACYEKYGLPIIDVPVLEPEKRAEFVLQHVQ